MSDPAQYTVGWICALETEYVAARAFLDKKHARPDRLSSNDNNHYTLGEIGGHPVVIAVLPDGEYGISSAAGVARDMLHSFPNIRFGLMVGIGGGVPFKHDIRLGDIIVSSPRNGRGGLLQYDFGKELQGQKFHQTGFLNQPPPILRTAVAGLQAQYEEEGHRLKENIRTVLEGNKRLKRKYGRPPMESDRLYESHYAHLDPNESCDELCDSSKLIRRPRRPDEDDDPAIQYGLIASGNRVVKDALFRDELAASQDVLCFEMEAAGLMNHFPCLVIRGICDYSDSHKSKKWQGYSAMTAAAYAKDLLSQITPQRLDAERKASDVLNDIRKCLDGVSGNINSIRSITTESAQKIENMAQNIDLLGLPVAEGAEFETYMDQHEEECLQGTRKDLLHQVGEWAVSPEGKRIFWLNGLAGTGKSTISRTVARSFQEQGLLGASFFFKRGEGDRGNAARFFPTIARQLLTTIPELHDDIQHILRNNPRISARPLKEQFDRLVYQPFHNLYQSKSMRRALVIVIDALDECEGDNDIRIILQQLPRSVCLRFFITSRPELPIRLGFRTVENNYQDLILHDIPEQVIEHDISLFLEHRLSKIRKERDLGVEWPGKLNFMALLSMSIPLFNFAATICRLFEDHNLDPQECLLEILKYQNEESRLEKTYLPVLRRVASRYDGMRQMQFIQDIQELLGTIIFLETPLSTKSLSRLMGITLTSIKSRLSSLHSVLHVPNDITLPIRIFHLSFRDFLLKSGTHEKTPFGVDENKTNVKISNYCLSIMMKRLKKNICNLPKYGTQRKDIDVRHISRHLPPELQYACRYWIHHVTRSSVLTSQLDHVCAFLEVHFLHWMEVMSILGFVWEVVEGISNLKLVLHYNNHPRILEFLDDAKKFVLKNSYIAGNAPLQIYASGLIFAPKNSIIKKLFSRDHPNWIQHWPTRNEYWGPTLQSLECHTDRVTSVAFSPNEPLLASGSLDQTIKLWDPATGALKRTLDGHKARITSIAFSPDGRLLASGSYDGTIRLWNPHLGIFERSLDDPHGRSLFEINNPDKNPFAHFTGFPPIESVAFSPNGRLLAAGATDGSIKLWNSATGSLERILQNRLCEVKGVRSVAFSPDGRLLAAGLGDGTIQLWNSITGVLKHTMSVDSCQGAIYMVAFSSDGQLLASSDGEKPMLWDPITGSRRNYLANGSRAICFSPNGALLAVASMLGIQLWDPVTCTSVYTIELPPSLVLSIKFSPDGRVLAFASDNIIMLYDLFRSDLEPTRDAHTDSIYSVAFSPDGRLLASCSQDRSIKVWETATGVLKNTLKTSKNTWDWSTLAVFSHDNQLLASGAWGGTIRLWDPATSILKHILESHHCVAQYSSVKSIAFSPNDQLLASSINDRIIELWDLTTSTLKHSLSGLKHPAESIIFSPDGRMLASSSVLEINLWDLSTGTLKHTMKDSTGFLSISFLPDGQLLGSRSDIGIKFWDLATGAVKHTLETYADRIAVHFGDTIYLARRMECFTAEDWRRILTLDFLNVVNKLSLHDNQWVTIQGQRQLWLPPEYRPVWSSGQQRVLTVKDGALALGCGNGRVHVIIFPYTTDLIEHELLSAFSAVSV